MAVAIPYIMAATAVAGVAMTHKAGKDAGKARLAKAKADAFAAKKAARIADIKAARERQNVARNMRIERGKVQNKAAAAGASTSTETGQVASINSGGSGIIHRGDQISAAAREASIFNQQQSVLAQGYMDSAGRAQRGADIFAGVGNIASIFKATPSA
jgi:hypothetical protein